MGDSVTYPRVYRAELRDRVWYFVLAALAMLGGPALMLRPRHQDSSRPGEAVIFYGLAAGCVLFGLAVLWMTLGAKVVLHEDAIEVFEPPGRPRRISRAAIASRAVVRPPKGRSRIGLTPRDEPSRPVLLPPALITDDVLAAWLAPIPVQAPDPKQA